MPKKRSPSQMLFRPPRVFVGQDQLVIPIVHPSKSQMRVLKQLLDGGPFHIKAMSPLRAMYTGHYFFLAKLKRAER